LLTKKVPAYFAQYKNVYWNSKVAKEEDKRVGSDGLYYKHKEKIKDC